MLSNELKGHILLNLGAFTLEELYKIQISVGERIKELELEELDKRALGGSPAAQWLRAYLMRDIKECERIRKEFPDDYWRTRVKDL